jgi:hypothetical protein
VVADDGDEREGETIMNVLKSIVVGFIAGAIAAVSAQEFISWLFVHYWTGWNEIPWSMEPVSSLVVPDVVVPWIASTAVTGGLWGALFGLILGWKPEGMMTVRGAILGLFGPGLIGALLTMPYLAHRPSPFFEGNVSELVPIVCIAMGFGAVTAWLYGLFSYGRLP